MTYVANHHDVRVNFLYGVQLICFTCGGMIIFDSHTDEVITPVDLMQAQNEHEIKHAERQ